MPRKKPNIFIPAGRNVSRRDELNQLVLNVIDDSFIYDYRGDEVELTEDNFLKVTLNNKRFIVDTFKLDDFKDYVKVYLYSVEQEKDSYDISVVENNIVITFNKLITRVQEDVLAADFVVKGKITEVS